MPVQIKNKEKYFIQFITKLNIKLIYGMKFIKNHNEKNTIIVILPFNNKINIV